MLTDDSTTINNQHATPSTMLPDRPHRDPFPIQVSRILELIEMMESQYKDVIEDSGPDLKNGMRLCAIALQGYIESHVQESTEPLSTIT